jgi:hypothetical protein
MTTTLSYAIKYVSSMENAVRFHRDQLGINLRFESPHWSEFETGSTTLALHISSPENPAGSCQLGFRVPDIASFYAQKGGRGIEFTSPPAPLHGQQLASSKTRTVRSAVSVGSARPSQNVGRRPAHHRVK